jgi:hypothetical protein
MRLSKHDVSDFGNILSITQGNHKCASCGKDTSHTFYKVSNGRSAITIGICDSCSEAHIEREKNG